MYYINCNLLRQESRLVIGTSIASLEKIPDNLDLLQILAYVTLNVHIVALGNLAQLLQQILTAAECKAWCNRRQHKRIIQFAYFLNKCLCSLHRCIC